MACINCHGKHCAFSVECLKWKVVKQVQQIKVEKQLSLRLVCTALAVVDKSYASAPVVPSAYVTDVT